MPLLPPEDEKKIQSLGFKEGKIIGGKWTITQKLATGGFGSIFTVKNMQDQKLQGALKVELSRKGHPNHMQLETLVFKDLHAEGFRPHIPVLYRSGKTKDYYYMIISLLGPTLLSLLQYEGIADEHFSLPDLVRVGIQSLYAIKTMHDRGYIHRDIKPENFMLGCAMEPAVARFVYIIDFGLARAFAYPPPPEAPAGAPWLARRARSTLKRFRGTYRYASAAMHELREQGRKDDLWSWLYTLIELYCDLPWRELRDEKMIEKKKLYMPDADLMIKMPTELHFIPEYLRTLNVYSRPDYYRIFEALDRVRMRCNVTYVDRYSWEENYEDVANTEALKKMQPQPGYMSPAGFFIWDPLHINGPPTVKEEEEIKERAKKRGKSSAEDGKKKTTKQYPASPFARSFSEKSSDFKPDFTPDEQKGTGSKMSPAAKGASPDK